ncbi:MAG: cytochrome P450 [Actinophytocola sp.]|uniref:cytochrome P450 n=1 Tax=Actinophytocola sp. TaxID=1872138 RepID=UPI003C75424D
MTEILPDPVTIPFRRRCPFDPPEEYARLREERPITSVRLPGGRTGWLVTRYEDIRTMLANTSLTPHLVQVTPATELPLPEEELEVPPGTFAAMDQPEHTRYRKLIAPWFTPKRVEQRAPRIRQIVDGLLAGILDSGPPADLVSQYAKPLALTMVSELLGLPQETRAGFQAAVMTMFSLDSSPDQLRPAHTRIYQGLGDLVAARHSDPGPDLVSELVHAGQGLTDEEIVNMAAFLLLAGLETSSHMISLGTFALLEHPDALAALRADPDLIGSAVEELFRYLTIVQFGLTRVAREDFDVAGQRVHAGEIVIASLAAANRDPAAYTEPDRLDLHRNEATHLALGYGSHHCLGAHLARAEIRIAIGTLLQRIPGLRLAVPAEQVRRGDEDMVFYGLHLLPVTWS